MRYNKLKNKPVICKSGDKHRWAKFIFGLLIIAGMALFFGSGYAPPGVFGEVLRHNQEYNVDASPFFYGDVENMAEYEDGVQEMRLKAQGEYLE